MRHLLIVCGIGLAAFSANAQTSKTIELADLVSSFMPSNGGVDWSVGSNNRRINWKTNGVQEIDVNGGVNSLREGEVVVTVDRKPLQVLRKRSEPVKWKITLHSEMPAKFGPESVDINPDSHFDVDIAEYLKKNGFSAVRECELKIDGSNFVRGYLIGKGSSKAYISETISGGSGGNYNSVKLHWSKPKNLCE